MSDRRWGPMVATAVLGVSLCAGAVVVLESGPRRELAETRQRLAEQEAELARLSEAQSRLPATLRELAAIRAEADAVGERGQLVRESARLYGQLMRLAVQFGVTVERFEPGEVRAVVSRRGEAGPGDQRVMTRLTVVGPYARVVGLLAALEERWGHTALRSVMIEPEGDAPDNVRAAVDAEQFWFELDAGLRPEQLQVGESQVAAAGGG